MGSDVADEANQGPEFPPDDHKWEGGVVAGEDILFPNFLNTYVFHLLLLFTTPHIGSCSECEIAVIFM